MNTLHSFLYVFDDKSSTPDRAVFNSNKNLLDKEKMTILFVEECSLMSDKATGSSELHYGTGRTTSDFFEFLNLKINKNLKVIFVGDGNQLPPVGADFSVCLSSEYLESAFGVKTTTLKLQTNYRQATNPELLNFINDFVSNGVLI